VGAGGGRQVLCQIGLGLLRERGEHQTIELERIGGHDAGAAGIGDNGDAIALEQWLIGKSGGKVKQLLDGIGAQHPRLPEPGTVGRVRTGQTASVRGHGARTGGCAA